MASSSNETMNPSNNDGVAPNDEDRMNLFKGALVKRQWERWGAWESTKKTSIDMKANAGSIKGYERAYVDVKKAGGTSTVTTTLENRPEWSASKELFEALVLESLIGKSGFPAWAAKPDECFWSLAADKLRTDSKWVQIAEELMRAPQESTAAVQIAEELMRAPQESTEAVQIAEEPIDSPQESTEASQPKSSDSQRQEAELRSEAYYFVSIAEGMLEASYQKDELFLNHILKVCHTIDPNPDPNSHYMNLWQKLRSIKDARGYTPLHIAVIMGFHTGVEMLIRGKHSRAPTKGEGQQQSDKGNQSKGADDGTPTHSRENPQGQSEWEYFDRDSGHECSDFDLLHARTLEGWTALHLSAVAAGYDFNCRFEGGHQAPEQAGTVDQDAAKAEETSSNGAGHKAASESKAASSAGPGHETLKNLMSMYDKVETPVIKDGDFMDNTCMTPLHYAVLANQQEQVTALVNWKGFRKHVDACDYHQKTALHMAVCHSTDSPFRKLPQHAQLGQDFEGRSLFESYAPPSVALIKILAEHPAVNLHAVDCCLYTPLHWAVHVGSKKAAACLLSKGLGRRARVTMQDIEGRSVMHLATEAKVSRSRMSKQMGREVWDSEQDNIEEGLQMDNDEHPRDQGGYLEDIQTQLLARTDVKEEIERLYRDRQVHVDSTNALLVGAALVASVTFQGWLQPPSTDMDDDSYRAIQIFWAATSLSFFFSVASVIAGAAAALPVRTTVYIGHSVRTFRRWLSITSFLLIIAALFALTAFVSAGLAAAVSLPSMTLTSNLKTTTIVTAAIGMAVCFSIVLFVFYGLFQLYFDDIVKIVRAQEPQVKAGFLGSVAKLWMCHWIQNPEIVPPDLKSLELPDSSAYRQELKKTRKVVKESKGGGTFRLSRGQHKRAMHGLGMLKCTYEDARKQTNGQTRQRRDESYEKGSRLMAKGIHHWMGGCPIEACRKHSLEADLRRWIILAGKVDSLRNIFSLQNKFKTFEWEECYAMCMTLHRVERSIGIGWYGFSFIWIDWCRFCNLPVKKFPIFKILKANMKEVSEVREQVSTMRTKAREKMGEKVREKTSGKENLEPKVKARVREWGIEMMMRAKAASGKMREKGRGKTSGNEENLEPKVEAKVQEMGIEMWEVQQKLGMKMWKAMLEELWRTQQAMGKETCEAQQAIGEEIRKEISEMQVKTFEMFEEIETEVGDKMVDEITEMKEMWQETRNIWKEMKTMWEEMQKEMGKMQKMWEEMQEEIMGEMQKMWEAMQDQTVKDRKEIWMERWMEMEIGTEVLDEMVEIQSTWKMQKEARMERWKEIAMERWRKIGIDRWKGIGMETLKEIKRIQEMTVMTEMKGILKVLGKTIYILRREDPNFRLLLRR